MTRIDLEDGKYTITYDQGILKALRYGDEWRDMTGDKVIGAMVDRIDMLELANTQLQAQNAKLLEELNTIKNIQRSTT